ncbi:16S rRNA (guanine(966)-N(2))-methyltransferase RsmD [Roseobacter sinensis]|uniref:16S rRNA (Guanine(966)-N(2))-methyltransferase RsmD n=1 Tax=Roseobacter sinensis TaxID=2931391 RepID=A0ABT3BDH2_9RHOB|nr:16S rRNA (guanine(966)-N(2))-methyltransferase RsmD [Roseobacter sp. WL0113]MCV3271626.1 16S rRNA (guanine(966)-N(2))-methyltransferase RsmD [Roseobacter sp. WL0113]
MRIIAGEYRGTALATVGRGDTAAHLRPTTDRVRESLFSVLTHHDVIAGARVLDVFAGTGALGLEALSRGATRAAFVDDGRVAQGLIRQNIAKLRVQDRTETIRRNALHLPARDGMPFDLVFVDPPYGKGFGAKALAVLETGGWLSPEAFIVWEEAQEMPAPSGFEVVDRRRYGDTHITLLSKTTP